MHYTSSQNKNQAFCTYFINIFYIFPIILDIYQFSPYNYYINMFNGGIYNEKILYAQGCGT